MKKAKIPTDAPATLTHNPFTKLGGAEPPKPQEPKPAMAPPPRAPPVPARAVICYERAGRGGKEVTILQQLALRDRDLEAHLSALKKSLGCGGRIEDHTIVLQGDQRERVEAWLVKLGVTKVIRGS